MLRRILCATVASLTCLAPAVASADEPATTEPPPAATPPAAPAPVAPLPPELYVPPPTLGALPEDQVGMNPAESHPQNGIYTRVELGGFFPLAHRTTVANGVAYGPDVPRKPKGLYGMGAGVRVGYSMSAIQLGVEGFFQINYDHSAVAVSAAPGRTDNWAFHRPGGTLGAAARWLPKVPQLKPVQPTVGFGLALSGRSIGATRQVEDVKDKAHYKFYVAPTLIADAGVMIGKVPGVRIFVGIQMTLDLSARQNLQSTTSKEGKFPIPPNANVQTSTRPDIFLGPVVGLVIGH